MDKELKLRETGRFAGKVCFYLLLAFLSLFMLYPLIFMFLVGFFSAEEYNSLMVAGELYAEKLFFRICFKRQFNASALFSQFADSHGIRNGDDSGNNNYLRVRFFAIAFQRQQNVASRVDFLFDDARHDVDRSYLHYVCAYEHTRQLGSVLDRRARHQRDGHVCDEAISRFRAESS